MLVICKVVYIDLVLLAPSVALVPVVGGRCGTWRIRRRAALHIVQFSQSEDLRLD